MNRLNKKGFTLVELLAVIIILAVVVGITIPTVLNVTETAKKKAFETAVDTIETYIQSQVDMSQLSSEFHTGDTPYVAEIGTASDSTATLITTVLEKTGYSDNISTIQWSVTAGKVSVTCATANEDNNEFLQSDSSKEKYSVCK